MPGLLDLRAAKGGFDLRVMLVGVVSDEDEVSSWVSINIIYCTMLLMRYMQSKLTTLCAIFGRIKCACRHIIVGLGAECVIFCNWYVKR